MQKWNLLYSVCLSCAVFMGPLNATYHSIQEAVTANSWGSVVRIGSEKIRSKKTTIKKIEQLAQLLKSDDLLRIVKGTKGLMKLQSQTLMTDAECFAFAAFIEKKLPQIPQGPQEYDCFRLLDEKNSVLKKGYYSPELTKLKYPIQFVDGYDLQEMTATHSLQYIVKRKVFIHLKDNKSVYYKGRKSILMGNKLVQNTSELDAIRSFGNEVDCSEYSRVDALGNRQVGAITDQQNLRCMLSYAAFLDLPEVNGVKAKTVVSPIYTDQTLHELIFKAKAKNSKQSKPKFTPKEKVKIFKDIVQGLSFIHENNCANRDLDMRNCYVQIRKKRKSREVSALIGNLHAVYPCSECVKYPIQYNRAYLPPEAYQNWIFDSHIAVQASDIFAAGCIGWKLLFEKDVPWAIKATNELSSARYKNYLHELLPQLTWMQMKISREPKSFQSRFMKILCSMLSHNPYDRKSAKVLLQELEVLYKRL